jgi:flagellar biosynthetic protein FlhB
VADPSKTEKPTPKRRKEARSKGDVGKSADASSAISLAAALIALFISAPAAFHRLQATVSSGLARSGNPGVVANGGFGSLGMDAMRTVAYVVAPIAFAALAAGVAANVVQVGVKVTPQAMKPSFKRVNPLAGAKRLFGTQGAVNAVKAVAKIGAIGTAAFVALWPALPALGPLVGLEPANLPGRVGGMLQHVAIAAVGAFLVIGVLDWVWQRRKHEQGLKMTKSEIKQEARQSEVAPEVRGAIRRRQGELARKRMLSAVPTADVVVTNPTHYAVALRYEPSLLAPEVVAKGADLVAEAIRRVAREHGVPVIESPPLARSLYAQVDLGALIPEELFAAVAEILAFVYRQAARKF